MTTQYRQFLERLGASVCVGVLWILLQIGTAEGEFDFFDSHNWTGFSAPIVLAVVFQLLVSPYFRTADSIKRIRKEQKRTVNWLRRLSAANPAMAAYGELVRIKSARDGVLSVYAETELQRVVEGAGRFAGGHYRMNAKLPHKLASDMFAPLMDQFSSGKYRWRTVTRLDFWSKENLGSDELFRQKQEQGIDAGGEISRILLLRGLPEPVRRHVEGEFSSVPALSKDECNVLRAILRHHEELNRIQLNRDGHPGRRADLQIYLKVQSGSDRGPVANFGQLVSIATGAPEWTAIMTYPERSFVERQLVMFENVKVFRGDADCLQSLTDKELKGTSAGDVELCSARFGWLSDLARPDLDESRRRGPADLIHVTGLIDAWFAPEAG